jgi:hypothetical protein
MQRTSQFARLKYHFYIEKPRIFGQFLAQIKHLTHLRFATLGIQWEGF